MTKKVKVEKRERLKNLNGMNKRRKKESIRNEGKERKSYE